MYLKKNIFYFYKKNKFAFYLGSTWFLLINSSLLFSLKYYKNFESRHPYIFDAINILKLYLDFSNKDCLKLLKKKGNIDSSNKRAKCELLFSFNNEKIYLNINAINIKKKKDSNSYDDENKDISLYLENPFLIKKEIKNCIAKIKSFLFSFIASDDNEKNNLKNEDRIFNENRDLANKKEEIHNIIRNGSTWKIDNIILVKKKIDQNDERSKLFFINNFFNNFFNYSYQIDAIYGNPIDNSYFYKYDNKKKTFNNTQKNLMKVMLFAFFFSSILAIKRIFIYKNSYSSLNFVKHFVCNNKNLHNILGNNQIHILSISGIHEKNYLNSKIFFQAKEKQGVIQMTATRNGVDKHFSLLHAKLLYNYEIIELKKN
ncbi:conserved Plasmodium protein, unknown function [Plasmodium gallinaceum]|uniref:Transmembrane protein n=1 Tax=Plasmodium gallinaceum TaxID=5849 RepID=A0A1J1GT50_PLAGA|nr:conserved Plasmodium protein, unknown function [Plasmodium gallinaceum]CRG94227.1 conserved Plasmodium protein, unknown function [Plasmodium gallinaceum]